MAFLIIGSIVALAGCGKPGGSTDGTSPASRTSSGGASTSELITAVENKLKTDPELASIKVTEQNGSIQLDGIVKDIATKDKAENLVGEVLKAQKSPNGMLNNIQIKEASPPK